MSFTVAIVGRPNVGKSTLFNRLIGERKSIVDDISGVTRDRIYGKSNWNGKHFTVIDTGGLVTKAEDIFETAIKQQVAAAIEEASVIIFLVDVTTGITDLDEAVANMLRRVKKRVFLAVNKVDNGQRELAAQEFWSLGFDTMFPLSSMNGGGTEELLDAIASEISDEEEVLPDIPKIAIIGQPNTGKSSLINLLLDEERNVVTDIAGTTRDPVHSRYSKYGKDFMLIDTAGIRKKAKVHEDLEFYSVIRAIRAMEEADVCILMIDATKEIGAQDMELVSIVIKRNKGLVILINKWDLIEKDTNTVNEYTAFLHAKLAPFTDVPILFTSVLEKQRIYQAVEKAIEVYENRSREIKTSELNDKILESISKIPPPSYRGHLIKIKYITQLKKPYPVFVCFSNYPTEIPNTYRQYIENQMRSHFNFHGVPMKILFRDK